MKKLILVLTAIALMMACTAVLAEEEPAIQEAPDPDNYSGVWQCDRASIEIVWEEEGYRILIHWGSSAWECTEWEYSCYYHEDDNTLVSMPFGIRKELVYSDDNELPEITVVYEDGDAVFSLDEEGHPIWTDLKENMGENMQFEWISEIPEIEEDETENG